MDHPIFHTPYEVSPTLEERPTPAAYAHHPAGRALGDTMAMWRVQTEGYGEGTGQLIGLVSRDAGFLDSPDTEWISGGVNSKGPNAVAIGRHGNFLHWGFAASPTYLTDEARLALVNALHYIARFNGQVPVARKVEGTLVRDEVRITIAQVSDAGYSELVAYYAELHEDVLAHKAEIQARKDAGETLSDMDKAFLRSPPPGTPERFERVRDWVDATTWSELGEDPARVEAFLLEHLPYFYPTGRYQVSIDTDLVAFGVGNDDPAFLERAVAALEEDGARADLARRLLERYTQQRFEDPAAWRAWLDDTADERFFSDSAGYLWLVDRPGGGAPAAGPAVGATKASNDALEPTPDTPLVARLVLGEVEAADGKDPDGEAPDEDAPGGIRHVLHLELAVLEGWHAYLEVPPGSPYLPLLPALELTDGVRQIDGWQRPRSHVDPSEPGLLLFEGRGRFTCTIEVDPDLEGPVTVTCRLRQQVCDANMCQQPRTEELSVVLPD